MSSVMLSWASAEVKDATLTVALDGEVPEGWKESFERTVKLLGNGEWGEVKINKGAVRVSEVTPGSEDKLRHHLESIVNQANAAHEAREREAGEREAREAHDGSGDSGEEPGGPDDEMTGRFRAFAEEDEDSSEKESA
jgi:hypothetical protein